MAEEAKTVEKGGGGQNKGMMLIIVAMLGLIIVALAGVAVFLIMNMGGDDGGDQAVSGQYDPNDPQEVNLVNQRLLVFDNAPFTTVNSITGGSHMLSLQGFTLGLNNTDEEYAEELFASIIMFEPALVALIIGIMQQYSIEALEAPGGWEMLKRDILTLIQIEFETNAVVAVYFGPMRI